MIPTIYKCHQHALSGDDGLLLINSGCEIVCVDVTLVISKHRFIVVYRPPNTNNFQTTALANLIVNLTHPVYNTIIVGDFNLPKIDWCKNEFPYDGLHDVMYESLNSTGFVQFVHEASRITRTGSTNILDLIFCNNPLGVNVDRLDSPISNSDHATILFSVFLNHRLTTIFLLPTRTLNLLVIIGQPPTTRLLMMH